MHNNTHVQNKCTLHRAQSHPQSTVQPQAAFKPAHAAGMKDIPE